MSDFNLSKLMEGKNPQSIMLEETRALRGKWEQTGLLEGLDERSQGQISVLLENQAKQLLDEATSTGTSAGSEEWSGVALPLVRRIFGEIASKEFVSVQPMNLPSGLIFYLDFKYGSNQPGNPAFKDQSLFGGNGIKLGSTDEAVNGLYGEGRYSYSINDVEATLVPGKVTVEVATDLDVNFDPSLKAAVSGGLISKLSFASSALANPDLTAVRSFHFASVQDTDFDKDAFFPAHTKVEGDRIIVFVKTKTPNTAGKLTKGLEIKYSKQTVAEHRGDFEAGKTDESTKVGEKLDIPEIDLELKSEAIVAKTRKLKAVWTPELAQDLNAYHSIDAEAELTSMLSEYISLEIDLEILDMLKSAALTTEYWSATIGQEYDKASGKWVGGAVAGVAYQKNTWFQTLGVKLNKVSNKIHQLTMRGGANFVVASPDVCTILESIPGFTVNADKDATSFAAGVTTVGSLANRFTVYKNPYMTSNEILLGFKGSNFLESGAVYAPYVPLIMTPLVYDPENFTPRRGVMTRYAKKVVRPEFFGKIYVKDLQNI